MDPTVQHTHVHTAAEIADARRRIAWANTLKVGMFAIAVGMLGAYMFDWHKHSCASCGNRWGHLGAFNIGDERTHTCARCGQPQWRKDA